ncbi:MAG TPA: penicillin-binding protein 2 [Candidatus Bathyarchaeia archaeon]|nr:penicillin-binding protein 2 [Candidatus Bathyarchaeia archaeon]
MRTYYESDIRRRVKVLTFCLAGWAAVVALRLIQIQVFGHARAKAAVLDQARDIVKIEPRRGNILDRNGEILASSQPAPSVAIRPVEKEGPAVTRNKVLKLQKELGLTSAEVEYVVGRLREGFTYTYVKKQVSEADAARVMALKLAGVELDPGMRRTYPHGALASHVLGGMTSEPTGIEKIYDRVLKGQEGEQLSYKIPGGGNYETQIIKSPVPGRDITLTIDTTIQYIAERELTAAVAEHGAAAGTAVVMDPQTGEILAMACVPTYDANSHPGPDAWLNLAVQAIYEPGSTFKVVTAAAARERNRVGYGELFDCSAGSIRVGGTTITDHQRESILSFPQVLIHSSNVGTVQFAMRLAREELYDTARAFGFGRKTGIDLPGEVNGKLKPAGEWNKNNSLVHIAIGYEVQVTAIQMLRAFNAFATGGLLVRPHLVNGEAGLAARPTEDGDAPLRAMSEKTARELVENVFSKVVEEGTAKLCSPDGYGSAGKTGTAQKVDPVTKQYVKKYKASFVGFTPLERPRLSIIVVMDEPKELYYGGQACAPVFKAIARQTLRYLRVPTERPLPARGLTADMSGAARRTR